MAQEFKVKELSSLDLKDGEMKQVELEGVEQGKVLLANSGGKIHATSSNCTHFGAPLAKGVLAGGKITCPWHGGRDSALLFSPTKAVAYSTLSAFCLV